MTPTVPRAVQAPAAAAVPPAPGGDTPITGRDGDLVSHLVRFARALREAGIDVGLSDEIDAASALELVDLGDRDEVRLALRAALKIGRRHWDSFEELFGRLWAAGSGRRPPRHEERPGIRVGRLAARARPTLGARPTDASGRDGGTDGGRPGYSPDAVLRRKPFDECSLADLRPMERLLARLALRVATRRSRRLTPSPARGIPDLRRSLRRAVATRGELVSLAHRARAVQQPSLVLLCDTSGSMEPHSRFLLAFSIALRRVAPRTEVFAFNTTLTRVTPWLASNRLEAVLGRLAAGVPDWSGGTRIGECFADFARRYLDSLVDSRTVVVILSDGLDAGDPEVLADAMRRIRGRARRLIWLNPLLGDPRYRPEARGMRAALPFVHRFAPAHNLESLERLIPYLGA